MSEPSKTASPAPASASAAASEPTQPTSPQEVEDNDAEMADADAEADANPETELTQEDAQPTEPTLPSRKDITLREFLSKMDDYAPIIPDAVTAHYLTLAGLPPPSATDPAGEKGLSTPLPLARLLALATQKFVADIAADAYQYSRIRANNSAPVPVPGPPQPKGQVLGVARAGFGGGGGGTNAQKTTLTMEDLGMAVSEYGINVKRGEYYR